MTRSGAEKTPVLQDGEQWRKVRKRVVKGEFLGTFVYGPTLTYTKTLAGGSQDE